MGRGAGVKRQPARSRRETELEHRAGQHAGLARPGLAGDHQRNIGRVRGAEPARHCGHRGATATEQVPSPRPTAALVPAGAPLEMRAPVHPRPQPSPARSRLGGVACEGGEQVVGEGGGVAGGDGLPVPVGAVGLGGDAA